MEEACFDYQCNGECTPPKLQQLRGEHVFVIAYVASYMVITPAGALA